MLEFLPIKCEGPEECLSKVKDGEVIALSSRFLARHYGELVKWNEVSKKAMALSEVLGVEPSYAEATLRKGKVGKAYEAYMESVSKPLSRCYRNVYGVKVRGGGFTGGVHRAQEGYLVLKEPDKLAKELARGRIGVIIVSTEVCDCGVYAKAIGCYGLREREGLSYDATPKEVIPSLPDALANASSLFMGEFGEGTPAVIIKGLEDYVYDGPCVRPKVKEIRYSRLLFKIKEIVSLLKFVSYPR